MDFSIEGFDAFAEQLDAQIAAVGPPKQEHALHHCLALGFQLAHQPIPGDLVVNPAWR